MVPIVAEVTPGCQAFFSRRSKRRSMPAHDGAPRWPPRGNRWSPRRSASTPPTNLVIITGPSRTADFELTLAMGAHGPERPDSFISTD